MPLFDCKKAQNCFNSKYAFMYTPGGRLGDAIIAWLAGLCPKFTCRRDLPKPFFKGTMEDATQVQGVIGDVAFKVTFPNASPEESKARFEALLEAFLQAAESAAQDEGTAAADDGQAGDAQGAPGAEDAPAAQAGGEPR